MGREWVERKTDIDLCVKAKLIEYRQTSYTEGQHCGVVMKYELLEIKKMEGSPDDFPFVPSDMIYVVHGVPETPRTVYHRYGGSLNSFRESATHLMRLKKKIPNNTTPFDIIYDPYLEDTNTIRYLCIEVDPVRDMRQWIEFFTF